MSELTYYIYNTQFGPVTIAGNTRKITALTLGAVELSGTCKATKVTNDCSTQLLQYFAGKRQKFTVPLHLQGTEFEKQVWQALFETEYGKTVTPTEIATAIGKPSACRKVTKAAHANKIPIIIPNHRLVPASNFEKPTPASKQRAAIRLLEQKFIEHI